MRIIVGADREYGNDQYRRQLLRESDPVHQITLTLSANNAAWEISKLLRAATTSTKQQNRIDVFIEAAYR